MRVLVIGLNYAPEPTGIAPYTTALCRGLVVRGHQVRVITTMPHYPEWRRRDGYPIWQRAEVIDGVAVTRLGHYVPKKPRGVLRLLSEVSFGLRAALARWGSPDVVVFVTPALFASAAAILGRLPRQPYVVWVQDLYTLGVEETRGGRGGVVAHLIRRLEARIFSSADGVAVIHNRFATAVTALGADPERVRVVRNWTHLAPPPRTITGELRVITDPDGLPIIALHSGAMGKKQNLENVIDAGRIAFEQGVDVRFVLMGNGGERARLERLAADVPTVSIIDPMPGARFQDALATADVLIVNEHAGLREMAVPSKLTSYFSSGRPVVAATDAGSVTAEEIAASGGGVRVEPAAPQALLEAVLEVGRDRERAAALGSAGQAYQREVLSEGVALDGYMEWLLELCRQHPRRYRAVNIRALLRGERFVSTRAGSESSSNIRRSEE